MEETIAHTSRLVKNSANIIVENRLTGQLEEEKMQVYVRLGIRLLYKVRYASHYTGMAPAHLLLGLEEPHGGCTRYTLRTLFLE